MRIFCTVLALAFVSGCTLESGTRSFDSGVCFVPTSVAVNRLSEITMIDDYNGIAKIKLFVDLTDKFGDNMKSPGSIRFELYEYKNLSANNTGSRIYSWPVLDISDPMVNHGYWQDSLRSYMFELDVEHKLDKGSKYVVSVTFISNNGQLRFSNTKTIEYYGK